MNPIRRDLVLVRFCMMLCLILSSCAKHQSVQQINNPDNQQIVDRQDFDLERSRILDAIIQQEAMLVDIPIPLYDERILPARFHESSDTLIFGYKSPLSCAQALDFFMNQMERYGWQHLVTFETTELLVQFASPDRYCMVVIQSEGDKLCHSRIFMYIKKGQAEQLTPEIIAQPTLSFYPQLHFTPLGSPYEE
jgi:hypothetical protein